ncbi:uncharacterized protein LOC127757639 [Oryza glaberrima]|nr:uncharacterized protein LOC127757639 [Oryza glaberrima]
MNFVGSSNMSLQVEQVGRIDYYCIGSIIFSDIKKTFILTQSSITSSAANLSVRFSDGFKQSASLILKQDVQESASGQCELCILMTDYHSNSKTVEFFEGDVDHSYAVAIAPESKYSVHNMPGFIIHRSLEVASDSSESVYKGSEDYFTFACRYGDTSPNLVSRLITGPVFNLNGQVLGIVVDDIEYKFWPKKPRKEDGSQEIIHEDLFYRAGYFLKVAIRVNNLQQDLRSMVKDNDWQNGLKKIATERRV